MNGELMQKHQDDDKSLKMRKRKNPEQFTREEVQGAKLILEKEKIHIPKTLRP